MTNILMVPQPFDSEILGQPVYLGKLQSEKDISNLDSSIPADAALVSIRIPAAWGNLMTASRFRFIERLITFERPLHPHCDNSFAEGVRLATKTDAKECAEIASKAFFFDRYHIDPELEDSFADTTKQEWTKNNLNGRADVGFVSETRGKIMGFNLCLRTESFAYIDLIAVAKHAQGLGLGKALIEASIAYYTGLTPFLRAGTQVTNKASVSIYRALGFYKIEESVTYHYTQQQTETGA